MHRKSFAARILLGALIIVWSFGPGLYGQTCTHPAITSVTISPSTVIGGIGAIVAGAPNDFTAVITLASSVPANCQQFFRPNRTPSGAGLNPFFCTGFMAGTAKSTYSCLVPSQVVDQQQTGVTVSFQATVSQGGAAVGNAVSSPAVTINPSKLIGFSVSKTSLTHGQTATGTVTLEGIVSNTGGRPTVQISASPSTAVTVPSSIQMTCCSNDGHLHSTFPFTITAKTVTASTSVTISVKRPNQTPFTRTITVLP